MILLHAAEVLKIWKSTSTIPLANPAALAATSARDSPSRCLARARTVPVGLWVRGYGKDHGLASPAQGCHAAQSLHSTSACSSTVMVAFSCLSGG